MEPLETNRPESPYLTPSEAAAILRVDRRTIYEWLRTGKLSGIKFGDSWRILRSTVETT
jgi:excisionase family DNA binding protein